ncbi:malonyl-coenzyme A:anthocyanin 3-O-glucoside-6''-O-malonyltransferase-like [Actinidia eriantha]|uniref:malonyl-coenzyme A:anthocyanin 3-O-glucoside-6''-O-malonyltransferase-like n=1 Tax=Actinidia eriantha TaxID=165200 RepID=UPI00258D29AF|nr:malonyl-coenzyme A:anthocyanin 3-O-glucoside-6''-O-malonyltransferase-like [Actinidia eriantha]
MASPNLATVVDVCRVAPLPLPPNATAQTSFPLTFFDMYFLKSYPTQRLFFYEAYRPPATFSEIILPNLERSLSLTLQHCLPLAGNLIWPKDSAKPVVQYVEGDAVLVTVTESNADFHRLSSNNFLESNEVNPYLPYLSASNARVPRREHQKVGGGTMEKKNQPQPSVDLSKFAITSAFTWVCLVRVRQLKAGKVHLAITVDSRARLEPPVPSTYFGNCLSGCIADADSDELIGEDGVAIAAKAIAEAIRYFSDGVLEGAKKLLPKLFSMQQGRVFNIVDSPRFEFYNIDFGWGRPRKADVINHDASFSLSASRVGWDSI